jgi:integrase
LKKLKTAVRWKVIDRAPCTVTMLKVSGGLVKFYDFDDYERLAEAGRAVDARTHLIVLLGGDAGLRRGEMLALRWVDVDFKRRQLQVQQAV